MLRLAIMGILACTLVAGCLAEPAPSASPTPRTSPTAPPSSLIPESIAAPPSAPANASEPAPVRLSFQGRILVGAVYEIPGHVSSPLDPVRALVWDAEFMVRTTSAPKDMQLSLDWTGTGLIGLMVYAPLASTNVSDGWPQYFGEVTGEQHQCMRIPPKDLVAGDWHLMAHSYYAADVKVNLTAIVVGGNATVPDEPGTYPLTAETAEREVGTEVYTRQHGGPRETIACDPRT